MKLRPVTKLDKRNTTMSKKIDDDFVSASMTSLSFFRFMAGLEQFGGRIPNAWSRILNLSLITTFSLTKTENRTKKSLILSKITIFIFVKNADFLAKNADIKTLVL